MADAADTTAGAPPVAGLDWGLGRYERTAALLAPAARAAVDAAAPTHGEHVVDLGCGTGNAALLAAARGARVTGVDPAARLLGVARDRAAAEGVRARFVPGHAAAIPVPDGGADAVVSVFGVVFAPDPAAAAAELARVTAPRGRVVLSAWIPVGAVSRATAILREAVQGAGPAGPPPFAWHEPDALAALLAPHGLAVTVREERLPQRAASAERFVLDHLDDHPLGVAARRALEPRGELAPVRERVVGVLAAANEDPAAFCVTSRYVVATARRVR